MKSEVIANEIVRLRRRATLFRMQSYIILLFIVGTIGGGTYIFYFASQLTETEIAGISTSLETTTNAINEDSARVRQLLVDREVATSAASQAIRSASAEVERSVQAVSAKLDAVLSQVTEIQNTVDSVKSIDTVKVQEIIDDKLAQSTVQYLKSIDSVESELSSKWVEYSNSNWRKGCIVPDGCDLNQEFDRNGLFAIMCSPSASEDAEDKLSHCEQSYYNGILGRQTIFRCSGETTTAPDFRGLTSKIDMPFDDFEQIEKDVAAAKIDNVRMEFDLLEDYSNLAQQVALIVNELESLPLVPEDELMRIDATILDQYATIASSLIAASEGFLGVSSSVNGKGTEWYSFVEQITVRVTVVILIIFLVQILVNLFRYSTRIASFFDGRADALSLIENSDYPVTSNAFHNLVMSMSPDSVDFGKSPKSPMDSAVELSRQIVSVGRKLP